MQWKRFSRQKKKSLGDVLVLDRLVAIKAAKDLLAKVQLGTLDPQATKREAMRAAKTTFQAVAASFLDSKKVRLRRSTFMHWRCQLTGSLFKSFHNLPLDEITPEQINACISKIADTIGGASAASAWTALSVLFKWAAKTGKLPVDHHNPMLRAERPSNMPTRSRVLTDDEIRTIWRGLQKWEQAARIRSRGWPIDPGPARGVQFLFLTGLRAQEVGGLERQEVDLDNGEVRIPASRVKNKRDLHNPLCNMAVEILRRVELERPDSPLFFGHVSMHSRESFSSRGN